MRLHFIGVGKMGLPMALHLRASGAELSVSDFDAVRCSLANGQGLTVAPDTAHALRQVDGVFSSLPHDAA
ncbi:NAD(P)-binding domain-containing protein, partial [Hydrogenophaga sp.]